MNTSQDFTTYLHESDRSPLTIQGYTADLSVFARWFEQTNGEACEPQSITPIDIQEYRQFLLTVEQRKASTINRHLASLSVYLDWAITQGMIEQNPSKHIRTIKQTETVHRWLNKKEQYALQRAAEKDVQVARMRYAKRWLVRQRDASMVIFLLNTGLRLNEVINLQMEDLRLSERKGQIFVRQGKGSKQRTVPLNSHAYKAIEEWQKIRPDHTKNTFVFIPLETESARALSSRAIQRAVRRLGKLADLPRLSPHALRHTFAKNLVNSGVSIEKIAALLGHSNLNTTRIYITPSQQDLENAVNELV